MGEREKPETNDIQARANRLSARSPYVCCFSFLGTTTLDREENNDVWQPMSNHNRISGEHPSTILHDDYHFEPIDHDFSSLSSTHQGHHSHLIQRPVPIASTHSNEVTERPKKPQTYRLPAKRNSTISINPMDLNSANRSFTLSRSVTSDQLANSQNHNRTHRLYYCPSVQDVLDALQRRAFDKESFV